MKKSLLFIIVAILSFAIGVIIESIYQPAGNIFSDAWCNWFMGTYSIALGFLVVKLPLVLAGAVQLMAIFDPSIPTNSALALVQKWLANWHDKPDAGTPAAT